MDNDELEKYLEAPIDKKASEAASDEKTEAAAAPAKNGDSDEKEPAKEEKSETSGDVKESENKEDKDKKRHRSKDRDDKDRDRSRRRRSDRSRSRERSRRGDRDRDRDRRGGDRDRRGRDKDRDKDKERGRERDRASPSPLKQASRTPTPERLAKEKRQEMEELTRDVRTVFVGQLQVRVEEKDVKRFFKKVGGVKVKDIQLIKDKFTGRSKGFAYVELKSLEDVPKALMLNGQRFQFKKGKMGFPILVKASEAEKNYAHALDKQQQAAAAENGPKKLFIGNLHLGVTEKDLKTVLEPFGTVEDLTLARDPMGNSLGHGIVTFKTADVASKALSKINGLDLAGKMMEVRVADAPPPPPPMPPPAMLQPDGTTNASWKLDAGNGGGAGMSAQDRSMLMARLAGGVNPRPNMPHTATGTNNVPLGVRGGQMALQQMQQMGGMQMPMAVPHPPAQPKGVPVGDASQCLVVKNMFDPATETDEDWDTEIKDEMEDECAKFGKLTHCFVDKASQGFVWMMFDTVGSGAACGHALHGRFFNRKMLAVQFFPPSAYTAKFGL